MAKSRAEFIPVVADEDFITRAWLVSGAYEVKSPLHMNRNMRIAAASWCNASDFWRPVRRPQLATFDPEALAAAEKFLEGQ